MKNLFLFVFIGLSLVCCKKEEEKKIILKDFKSVEIETILKDSLLNVRALEVDTNEEGVFATSNGRLGIIFKEVDYKVEKKQSAYAVYGDQFNFKLDTIIPNFRALARTKKNVFLLSIGSPAFLYKIGDHEELKVPYTEFHEKAFYDAMDFWNDQEGIAIGDPTGDCMSVIITRDGGDTWTKLPCDRLPKIKDGEAAFAASDTNIAIVDDHTWVATGGKASRILYSPDKGRTWEVFNTPIVQGKETTGIYSIDFYDALNGFGIGGDYTKAADSSANKIRTQDGGKTWQLVAQNRSPGYRSCVQYVPNGASKALVTLGFKGIDYSNDSGDTWTHLSDEGFYTLRFLNDSTAYAAGKGRIAKLTFRE